MMRSVAATKARRRSMFRQSALIATISFAVMDFIVYVGA
jgi:hypothetical protein